MLKLLLLLVEMMLISCGPIVYGFDADVYTCDRENCRAVWYQGTAEPEKTIFCTEVGCVCQKELALYDCEPLDSLTEDELERIWEEGCCR